MFSFRVIFYQIMRIAVRSIHLGSSSLPVSAGWSRRPWLGLPVLPCFHRIMWGKVAANDISIFEGRAVEQYSTGCGILVQGSTLL